MLLRGFRQAELGDCRTQGNQRSNHEMNKAKTNRLCATAGAQHPSTPSPHVIDGRNQLSIRLQAMKKTAIKGQRIGRRKAMGVHYTPLPLARFIASRLISHIASQTPRTLKVLDPACGDGVLLEALLDELRTAHAHGVEAFGIEADAEAIELARTRLLRFGEDRLQLRVGDFLDMASADSTGPNLWQPTRLAESELTDFDLVIANPPYVRTQVLGAARAQQLAARFGLSGRVDLSHAFVVAAAGALRLGGVLGIITSNRFLTTLAGASIRSYLSREFEIEEIIDLGDTKLFEAAVLPAVFFGRRRSPDQSRRSLHPARFTRVYACQPEDETTVTCLEAGTSVSDLLQCEKAGRYRVREGTFELRRGQFLAPSNSTGVWSLTTGEEADWTQRVRGRAVGVFGDIAAVRVGIKTTADEVFIRKDWDELPERSRPESTLLRPLLTHIDARRWALAAETAPSSGILYPHEKCGDGRRAVDLSPYPRAKAYLESHRRRLEGRKYVLAAGRLWYEVWVPQDPAGWGPPKIVFPDISAEPRFYLDDNGFLVNGDCYWISLHPNAPRDLLYLLLGLANSSLMSRFHDLVFNNKLYSGRRRYITQYVADYPYPSPESEPAAELASVVRQIIDGAKLGEDAGKIRQLETLADSLAHRAFGLSPGECIR